ncbi:MAG: HD-GYP domain-containing protein [Chloroflexi bacterium]|nr:MAG: HD-GYP domain-containing protein [Chloroflexota bacterium]
MSAKKSKNGRRGGVGKKVLFWGTVFIGGTFLAAVAFVAGWALALGILCTLLFYALWYQWRMARKERAGEKDRISRATADRDSVIEVLCEALGLRENVKLAYDERVAHVASILAWQMGLREDEVRLVRQAAILHDIGKIGIAEDVLAKPAPLSDQEWAAMKGHPEVGFGILNQISFLHDVAQVVHSHHERFDGQGYPKGLKGDAIPIASRIFAVIDSYVAMTSDRPYRKKMPHDIAVREIVRNSLTQFDPEVVQAFLEVEKNGLLEEPEGNHNGRAVRARVTA